MNTLREFICYNQKEIIRFEYTISQLHKDFRISMEKDSKEIQEEKYNTLILESFNLLENIFDKNTKYIINTFGKNNDNLRVSVKMIDDDNIVDIYRNTKDSMIFSQSKISENSGFDTIKSDKVLFYLNDNVEESFKNGTYKNHRLDIGKKEALLNSDITWEDCWTPYESGENTSYNSTLIIPMSITSEDEDKNSVFYKNFFEKKTDGKANLNSRAIWGYLCLDSESKNFFSGIKDFDVLDLGFIITDIISLYLVFFYNYTSGSDTVNKYLGSIK